jgi:antitoxin (DNA-binding transcriptional repressor) of toxin-antitoxin stability system
MKTITTHFAKTHLSRLLKDVQRGESITILHGKEPVAILSGVAKATLESRPRVGTATSAPVEWTDDAFEPLSDDDLKVFGL